MASNMQYTHLHQPRNDYNVQLMDTASSTGYSNIESKGNLNAHGLPSLGINASKHKKAIFLGFFPVVLTGGVFPIIGYFALHFGTKEKLSIDLAPWLALMGATTLFSIVRRTYRLAKKDSDCRPLGVTGRWTMDFFEWNFVFNFLALTAFIAAGSATANLTIVSLPNSIVIIYISILLLLSRVMMAAGISTPFRFSSIAKGQEMRPATMIIMEDIVAVDCKQGTAFRKALHDRYEASPVFRAHLRNMDLFWGLSGFAITGAIWGIVIHFRHLDKTQQIAYGLGWALPWIWGGLMAVITTQWSKKMLHREGQYQRYGGQA